MTSYAQTYYTTPTQAYSTTTIPQHSSSGAVYTSYGATPAATYSQNTIPVPSAAVPNELALTEQEMFAAATMRQRVDGEGLGNRVTDDMIIQFLMARKFQVDRAMPLLYSHLQWKAANNIVSDKLPLSVGIIRELESGRVIVPAASRDRAGAQVLYFRPALLNASTTANPTEFCVAVYYLLQRCIQDIRTQRLGFLFICDLRGTKMTSVDHRLIRTVIDMLQNKFPGRLRKVLLLQPPKFFRMVFHMIRPLISQKYLDKMSVVELPQLAQYIDPALLLPEFGGSLAFDQRTFIGQVQMDENKAAMMAQQAHQQQQQHMPGSPQGMATR